MVLKVYLQRGIDGEYVNPTVAAAYYGFAARGFETAPYTWEALLAGSVPLSKETCVVGHVRCVCEALRQLGLRPPINIDIPAQLQPYAGRGSWETTLGRIRDACDEGPVFIKPLRIHKAFTGHVVACFGDLLRTVSYPPDLSVMAQDVVGFVSEWRYYVHRGRVIGVGHYKGDPYLYPDIQTVRSAVAAYQGHAPIAYGLDMGVVELWLVRWV